MPRYFYSVRVKRPENPNCIPSEKKYDRDREQFRKGFGSTEGRFYYMPGARHSQDSAKRRAMKLAEVWGIKLDCAFEVREELEL